jgi:hypothetical protein
MSNSKIFKYRSPFYLSKAGMRVFRNRREDIRIQGESVRTHALTLNSGLYHGRF